MTPIRSEIWLVDLGDPVGHEQSGRRPALVVSTDAVNEGPSGVVVVVPLTSRPRGIVSHVEIDTTSGLDEVSYAKCEDIKSVSQLRVITRLGRVGPDTMFAVGKALRILLEI